MPDHCIENTEGSDIHSDLIVKNYDSENVYTVTKGKKPQVDSLSVVKDALDMSENQFFDLIMKSEIKTYYVVGLPLEYNVYATAQDI